MLSDNLLAHNHVLTYFISLLMHDSTFDRFLSV
jgi:hypothetical protein